MSTETRVPPLTGMVDAVEEAASQLGDAQALEMVRAVREHLGRTTLQVLIAGSTGSGRASLVNALGRGSLLPQSPLPKAPIAITVGHESSERIYAVRRDGIRTRLPRERLRSFLLDPATAGEYVALDVRTPCEPLGPIELRIEPLEGLYSAGQWEVTLSSADYVLMVLDATAPLSAAERQFIRDRLVPHAGTNGIGVVITKMDLIPEEERESIIELVGTFLGSFAQYSTVIPFSATEVGGGDALWTLLDDLLERQALLRVDAVYAALEGVLDAVSGEVARQEAMRALNEEEAQGLREAMTSKGEWLQSRIARAQRRIDAFVTTILKEEILREVEEFGETFRRRLPEEIASIEDVAQIRRHLPGYMETVWFEFLHWGTIRVRSRLMEEMRTLEGAIEADLRELMGDAAPGLRERFAEFRPASHTMHVFVTPRRGKHQASTVAKQLGYVGLSLLPFMPVLGVLSLSASQVVQRVFKREVAATERDAIVPAALAASRQLQRDLEGRIERQFATLGAEVGAEVAAAYGRGLAEIEEALGAAGDADGEASRARLHTLSAETIPRLRAQLAELRRTAPA